MVQVRLKPVVVEKRSVQTQEVLVIETRDSAALTAYQVMMPLFLQPLIDVLSAAYVGFRY